MARTATTLSASCGKADTSILVASATGFELGKVLKVEDEYMNVVGVSGTVIRVFRGLHGSAAKAHLSGAAAIVGDPQDFPYDNVGTPASGVSVTEIVNGRHHITRFDLSDFAVGAAVAAADLAFGKKIYDFPAGQIQVKSASIALGLTGSGVTCDADTPDLGIGTTIASGAVAVLGGTAGFEDILTGQTMADCNGTVKNAAVAQQLPILPSGSHAVHLNVADGWAGAASFTATGSITIEWVQI